MSARIVGLLICFFLSALPALAAEPAASLLEGADAVYLEVHETYTLEEDGSMVQRHEHRLRYLTPYAISRILGETFIVINPEFQELKIERATTTMADGQEVACEPNAFNEVLPGFCAAAPPYMHLRETVITHLGLEKDAVAHLVYEVKSRPGFVPFLMVEELFSDRQPIEKKTVTVRVPLETELKYRFLNGEQQPAISEADGYKQFVWTLEDLSMAPPERMAQAAGDHAPRLVFSTSPGWREASTPLNGYFTRATRLDKEAAEKARALFEESATPVDFVRSVNRFVVEEVAYAGVDPRYLGYKPLPSQTIYNHNVGCGIDKAALLVALLRSQGYFAEPVFVSNYRSVAEDVPCWSQFSECRVITTMRDRLDKPLFLENTLYLSPRRMVTGVYDEDLAGHTIYRPSLVNNQLQVVDPVGADRNRLKADLTLILDEEMRLSGDLALEVGGSLNPYLQLAEGYDRWAGRNMKALLPGGSVKALKPLRMSEHGSIFSATVDEPAVLEKREESDLYFFEIPHGPGSVHGMRLPVAPVERLLPLWLPRAIHEEINVRIALPDGLEAVALPPKVVLENSAGKVMQVAWVEENDLTVKRQILLPGRQIMPAQYADLRALIIEWTAPDSTRVVFQKTDSEDSEG